MYHSKHEERIYQARVLGLGERYFVSYSCKKPQLETNLKSKNKTDKQVGWYS